MNTARTLTIAATAAGLVLAAGAGATASGHRSVSPSADSANTMTFAEWYDVQSDETQANVEAPEGGPSSVGNIGCGCTGVKVKTWTGADGNDRKWVRYADTDANSSVIQYRLGDGGHWKTDALKLWQTDETGESFYYGQPTF